MQVDQKLKCLLPLIPSHVFESFKGFVDPLKRTVYVDILVIKRAWRSQGIGTSVVVALLKHQHVDFVHVNNCVNWAFWKKFRYLNVGPIEVHRHAPSLTLAGKQKLFLSKQ